MTSLLDLRGTARRLAPQWLTADPDTVATVRDIVSMVREEDDRALYRLTARHDGVDLSAEGIRVPPGALREAPETLPSDLREAIDAMIERVRALSRRQVPTDWSTERHGVRWGEIVRPLRRVGCYVPGGRAAYPSSVVMTVVPARTAGVEEVLVCTPPGPDGSVSPAVLYAAVRAGATDVLRIGGAQAIAAMAYGTASVPRVDKIVGPGNVYVTLAKREVLGDVGIDGLAGPSELVIVADGDVDRVSLAADAVAQAEHDPLASVTVVTADPELAQSLTGVMEEAIGTSERAGIVAAAMERARVVLVEDEEQAAAVVDDLAPEHLQILVAQPEKFLGKVRNAGAVFLGPWTAVPFGDYGVGSNHVLPTMGTARFASGLRASDFVTVSATVTLDAAAAGRLAPEVARIARAEGLAGHAQAVELRSAGTLGGESRPGLQPGPASRKRASYAIPLPNAAIRLHANESPYPPPRGFVEDLAAEVHRIEFNRYPDPESLRLREAIGAWTGQPVEGVWVGNGSNEIIQQLLLAYAGPGRRAVTFEPGYAIHRIVAEAVGTAVSTVAVGPPFELRREHRDAGLGLGPDIVFVGSPNNPTGTARPPRFVEELASAGSGVVIVDEAYIEFGGEPANEVIARCPNVVVVRTFSKAFGLAAARLGYCLASPEVVEELRGVRLPYHLSATAQAAGTAALAHLDEALEIVRAIRAQRDRLLEALGETPGVTPFPSAANFVLFRTERPAADIWAALLDRGVLVRDVSAAVPNCLRVTAGAPHEVDAFLAALEEVLR